MKSRAYRRLQNQDFVGSPRRAGSPCSPRGVFSVGKAAEKTVLFLINKKAQTSLKTGRLRAVPPVFVPKAHSLLSDFVDKPFGTTRVSLRPLRGDFNGSSYVLTPTARSLKSLRLLLLRFFALFNILLKYITIFIICQVFFSILQEIYVFGLKSLDFAVKICYNINKAAHKKSMRQRKELF